MANPGHMKILKQGVEAWNQWREANQNIHPNLRGANLSNANLSRADFSRTDLKKADLSWANLFGANFIRSDLRWVNFAWADIRMVNFTGTNLAGADFSQAYMALTIIGNVDLSVVKGLNAVNHVAPSVVSVDTIYRSKGNISEVFLRRAGVPEDFMVYSSSLFSKALEYSTCFISYSSKDQDFADRLYADLQSKGVLCWFAPHDLRIGDRFADRIEESIRTYDKLLVVLSQNSVKSTWVEDECRAALEKENRFSEEQQLNKTVLFPIKLDETIKEATSQWVCKIRRERQIGDFKNWKNHDDYQQAFTRLLRDLKAETSRVDE